MIAPPYRLSRPDRYCRLLPPFQHAGDPKDVEDRLIELAKSMFKAREQRQFSPDLLAEGRRPGTGKIAAAYTYFGQFIMHDLTFDDTPFRSAGLHEPEETINYRNPRLDLDSVYGDGPFSGNHRHLYEGIRFRLGTVTNPYGARFDVPLADLNDCLPAVADERNCENAILRQIHAMFLLLHNLAVDNLEEPLHEQSDQTLFEAARARVRWQFQSLVRDDFLPKVCNFSVYQAITSGHQRLIHWPPGEFSVPVEFSQAAARFGHSLVRPGYILRKHPETKEASLGELFGSTRRGGPLQGEKAVEWAHFTNPNQELARQMDTTLVNPFEALPHDTIHAFVTSPMPHDPTMLSIRTLCRGSATRLPTGQQLRVALQPDARIKVSEPSFARDTLRKLGFEHETPLWYYLLFEAENSGKLRLGPICSRIVTEVIEAALLHDRDSFLFQENDEWRRELLNDRDGTVAPITELCHLANVVGLERMRP